MIGVKATQEILIGRTRPAGIFAGKESGNQTQHLRRPAQYEKIPFMGKRRWWAELAETLTGRRHREFAVFHTLDRYQGIRHLLEFRPLTFNDEHFKVMIMV